MRTSALFLAVMLAGASAEAGRVCDHGSLPTATGAEDRALLDRGADPDRICNPNGDRPLHQAILTARDPGAVRAPVDAGGSILAESIHGSSVLHFAERRSQRDAPRTAGATFRECEACPEMVVMPGGRLALGRYEVTVGEYGAFASATGGGAGGGCHQATSEGWTVVGSASWRNPGFSQTSSHPVVCVSWHDAQEYVSWLSQVAGATYRLPSEVEWDRAAGGSGSGCSVNGGDDDMLAYLGQSTGAIWNWPDGSGPSCPGSDGSRFTASAGSYGSSGVGLSDMVGNVWEWTEDCWDGDCSRRVVRGGSWGSDAKFVRPSGRNWIRAGDRESNGGFRVARTLD